MTTYNQDQEIGFDESIRNERGNAPYAMPVTNHPAPEIVHSNLPVGMPDLGDDTGFENARMEEQTTPFLRMAQGLNPELNPGKGEYIQGITLGSIFNTASREFYHGGEGVESIACWRDYHYGAWIPRDINGGGFRGTFSMDDPLVRNTLARMAEKHGASARFKMPTYKDGKWTDAPAKLPETGEEVQLVETGQIFFLYACGRLTSETAKRAVVAFTSSSYSAYSDWVSANLNAKVPRWYANGKVGTPRIIDCKWRLNSYLGKSGSNEVFKWKLSLLPTGGSFVDSMRYAQEDPDLYRMAAEFYMQAKGGGVKIDEAAHAAAASGEAGDDVPF